jgi:hypothetical protein
MEPIERGRGVAKAVSGNNPASTEVHRHAAEMEISSQSGSGNI